MHAPKTLGDVSVLKCLSLGASGAGGLQQGNARVGNEIVGIQECRADLQDFLQRTRNRLQAIADNVNDCFENLTDEHDANRILRGADSAQVLKPLPILTPTVQRRDAEMKVNVSTGVMRSHDTGDQDHSTAHNCDPSSPSPSATERFATNARRQVVAGSSHKVAVPRAERGEGDWKVSNAFDRNAYYGPKDFALMPDDSEYLASSGLCSNEDLATPDAFCSGTPPIEFGGAQAQSSQKSKTSRLHLANQIRQN
jgi:hypothetical protein